MMKHPVIAVLAAVLTCTTAADAQNVEKVEHTLTLARNSDREMLTSPQCRFAKFRRHHPSFCADFIRWQISCAVNPMRIQPYTGNFYDGAYEDYLDMMRHPGWAYERETGQRCPV